MDSAGCSERNESRIGKASLVAEEDGLRRVLSPRSPTWWGEQHASIMQLTAEGIRNEKEDLPHV